MEKQQMGRKFQPRITPYNSEKSCELPDCLLSISRFIPIQDLEKLEKEYLIFYILDNSSTKGKLIPIRDEFKNFKVILMRKK